MVETAGKRRGLVEAEEQWYDPKAATYLKVGNKLHRISVLNSSSISDPKLSSKQKLIVLHPEVGEKVAVFRDDFKLKPGQGFEETIIWAKRAPIK